MEPLIARPRQGSATFTFCLLMLVLAGSAACGTPEQSASKDSAAAVASESGDVKKFQIRGKILQLEQENQAAVIEHQEIVGWMSAMTMRFPIKEKAGWEKLTVGAKIEGTVFVSDDGFYVGDVKLVDAAEQAAPPQP